MLTAQTIERLYPGDGLRQVYREELLRVCRTFIKSGYADSKFEIELNLWDNAKFWSCLSEALVFDHIRQKHFVPRNTTSKIGVGPDFLLMDGDRRVWVEVVCPEPIGIETQTTEVRDVPHKAVLLRWRSAIQKKADKLKDYLKKGRVQESDAYIIAVNGCQLREGPWSAFYGISQLPCAVEAVFGIGPRQIQIDRETLKSVGHGYQERYFIQKPNGATVPSYTFLDLCFRMISAIWAIDFNGCTVIGNDEPSALIHNPNASNPVSEGFLPSNDEYVAKPIGDDSYSLLRIDPKA
jgi:hypothetical protein